MNRRNLIVRKQEMNQPVLRELISSAYYLTDDITYIPIVT